MSEKHINMSRESELKDYKTGTLPHRAPLALAYVPMQDENPPKYSSEDALTRGTLFPGLDLPFMNKPNSTNPYAGTPLGEVMALDFMVKELNLYLDTHPDDKEAFSLLKSVISLSDEAREKYVSMYGPISVRDLKKCSKYTWLRDPWPWEYDERMGV